MVLSEEENRDWKSLAMILIGAGLAINLYLLWDSGQKTVVTNTVMRSGMNAISNSIVRR